MSAKENKQKLSEIVEDKTNDNKCSSNDISSSYSNRNYEITRHQKKAFNLNNTPISAKLYNNPISPNFINKKRIRRDCENPESVTEHISEYSPIKLRKENQDDGNYSNQLLEEFPPTKKVCWKDVGENTELKQDMLRKCANKRKYFHKKPTRFRPVFGRSYFFINYLRNYIDLEKINLKDGEIKSKNQRLRHDKYMLEKNKKPPTKIRRTKKTVRNNKYKDNVKKTIYPTEMKEYFEKCEISDNFFEMYGKTDEKKKSFNSTMDYHIASYLDRIYEEICKMINRDIDYCSGSPEDTDNSQSMSSKAEKIYLIFSNNKEYPDGKVFKNKKICKFITSKIFRKMQNSNKESEKIIYFMIRLIECLEAQCDKTPHKNGYSVEEQIASIIYMNIPDIAIKKTDIFLVHFACILIFDRIKTAFPEYGGEFKCSDFQLMSTRNQIIIRKKLDKKRVGTINIALECSYKKMSYIEKIEIVISFVYFLKITSLSKHQYRQIKMYYCRTDNNKNIKLYFYCMAKCQEIFNKYKGRKEAHPKNSIKNKNELNMKKLFEEDEENESIRSENEISDDDIDMVKNESNNSDENCANERYLHKENEDKEEETESNIPEFLEEDDQKFEINTNNESIQDHENKKENAMNEMAIAGSYENRPYPKKN